MPSMSLSIQISVADEDQPQVYAIISMISYVMIPLGALIAEYMEYIFLYIEYLEF
ncbi:hypothetical protein S101395_02650 [Bacillus sonorensis]|uniref:Major facilitator superfamily transporter n=2 Tax=Bacillus sonorensis TaxID=119858 RepID=M5PEH6_9BACI|nr:hypothetical protein S101395_02650 [Bacillus sonorensis]EME75615.1 major facilitator superfamily transporter [Bacillus sonorensis L12]GIN68373.1 hypothetical protein J41TS2_37940 [Bacillus sonorensis]